MASQNTAPGSSTRHSDRGGPAGGAWAIVLVLLGVHGLLVGWIAYRNSPTIDEPAHLAAGIRHWQYGDFRLYPVNPPLVRMLAALPVLVAGVETRWKSEDHGYGARTEFEVGSDLIEANGTRACWLVTLARWACLPFSLLGAATCFVWARQWYGARAGVLALALWVFCPNIIAMASVITPDLAASALGLAAGYAFWRWLDEPGWGRTVAAGIALGLVELAKTTFLIAYPLWLLLWIIYRSIGHPAGPRRRWVSEAAMLLTQFAISVYAINFVYGFQGSMKQLGDFEFVSETFQGRSLGSEADPEQPAERSRNRANRFAGTWLGHVPVPLPEDYVRGIDEQRRDFEQPRNPSYLRGELGPRGWWHYYLYALAVKVPLGMWALLLAAIVTRAMRRPWATRWRDGMVLLAPALVILAWVSSQTGFSHHVRYVLPVLPFTFVWISGVGRVVRIGSRPATLLCAALFAWSAGSSLWIYPHSLSYFNEAAGGPSRGHAHLLDSNIDWGQDLLYLKRWLDAHPEAEPLYLLYRGPSSPRFAGIASRLPASPLPSHRPGEEAAEFEPGWYALSLCYLRGLSTFASDDTGQGRWYPAGSLRGFLERRPVATAGYSIHVYRVVDDTPPSR